MNPKITIITPSYNQGHYLEQTIDSVLSQNYSNIEYIVIDGGSTDQSVEIIKKYEKYLAYWVTEKDNGQSNAINKGLQRATGEIVNWINSDDYYEPKALKVVAEAFRDKTTNVVCGRGKIIKANGKLVRYSRGTDVYDNNLAKTIGWARMDQPETFFRRSVFQTIGTLNDGLHYLMDRDLWIRYLLSFGLSGVKTNPDILINFRLHDLSKTVSQSTRFQIDHDSFFYSMAHQYHLQEEKEQIKNVCKINEEFILSIPDTIEEKKIRRVLNYYFLKRADEFYAIDERKKAKDCLSMVNPAYLKEHDRKLLGKLKFRNAYVPISLLQLMRKS